MATYVIADIHGEYEKLIRLLNLINLQPTDTLYVLGDILDRGPNPIQALLHLRRMPNVIPMVGNHELMALNCLQFLSHEQAGKITAKDSPSIEEDFCIWADNGSQTTIEEFRKLSTPRQQEVIDYIREFSVYEEVHIDEQKFLLVHAGLGNFSPEKTAEDYTLKELLWDRADYDMQYFDDTYVISGHTPTQLIAENPNPGYIFYKNNHIAIDCGACFPNGRLAAICLNTGEEFYSN